MIPANSYRPYTKELYETLLRKDLLPGPWPGNRQYPFDEIVDANLDLAYYDRTSRPEPWEREMLYDFPKYSKPCNAQIALLNRIMRHEDLLGHHRLGYWFLKAAKPRLTFTKGQMILRRDSGWKKVSLGEFMMDESGFKHIARRWLATPRRDAARLMDESPRWPDVEQMQRDAHMTVCVLEIDKDTQRAHRYAKAWRRADNHDFLKATYAKAKDCRIATDQSLVERVQVDMGAPIHYCVHPDTIREMRERMDRTESDGEDLFHDVLAVSQDTLAMPLLLTEFMRLKRARCLIDELRDVDERNRLIEEARVILTFRSIDDDILRERALASVGLDEVSKQRAFELLAEHNAQFQGDFEAEAAQNQTVQVQGLQKDGQALPGSAAATSAALQSRFESFKAQ